MFDFRDMLKHYEQDITIIQPSEGYWDPDSGQWVPGEETETETQAVVLPLTNDDLLQDEDEGGHYTQNDRKVYIHQKLTQGQKVKINGQEYLVHAEKDYSFHASGLRIYILVRKGESSG